MSVSPCCRCCYRHSLHTIHWIRTPFPTTRLCVERRRGKCNELVICLHHNDDDKGENGVCESHPEHKIDLRWWPDGLEDTRIFVMSGCSRYWIVVCCILRFDYTLLPDKILSLCSKKRRGTIHSLLRSCAALEKMPGSHLCVRGTHLCSCKSLISLWRRCSLFFSYGLRHEKKWMLSLERKICVLSGCEGTDTAVSKREHQISASLLLYET